MHVFDPDHQGPAELVDQHTNPNTWQYWCLLGKGGYPIQALEMPLENATNMVAKLISQAETNGRHYTQNDFLHDGRMILHNNTKQLILEILEEYNLAPIRYDYEAIGKELEINV